MGYTLEQYQALCAAIAQGARVVQYADKMVSYNTPEQMQRLKRDMETALGIDPDGNNDTHTSYPIPPQRRLIYLRILTALLQNIRGAFQVLLGRRYEAASHGKRAKSGWLGSLARCAFWSCAPPGRLRILDEADGFPLDPDGEGWPVDLARARTRTFPKDAT